MDWHSIKRYKHCPINKEVAFILVTSTNTAENIKEIREHGIIHYLVFLLLQKNFEIRLI